jgi:hypothetical protein
MLTAPNKFVPVQLRQANTNYAAGVAAAARLPPAEIGISAGVDKPIECTDKNGNRVFFQRLFADPTTPALTALKPLFDGNLIANINASVASVNALCSFSIGCVAAQDAAALTRQGLNFRSPFLYLASPWLSGLTRGQRIAMQGQSVAGGGAASNASEYNSAWRDRWEFQGCPPGSDKPEFVHKTFFVCVFSASTLTDPSGVARQQIGVISPIKYCCVYSSRPCEESLLMHAPDYQSIELHAGNGSPYRVHVDMALVGDNDALYSIVSSLECSDPCPGSYVSFFPFVSRPDHDAHLQKHGRNGFVFKGSSVGLAVWAGPMGAAPICYTGYFNTGGKDITGNAFNFASAPGGIINSLAPKQEAIGVPDTLLHQVQDIPWKLAYIALNPTMPIVFPYSDAWGHPLSVMLAEIKNSNQFFNLALASRFYTMADNDDGRSLAHAGTPLLCARDGTQAILLAAIAAVQFGYSNLPSGLVQKLTGANFGELQSVVQQNLPGAMENWIGRRQYGSQKGLYDRQTLEAAYKSGESGLSDFYQNKLKERAATRRQREEENYEKWHTDELDRTREIIERANQRYKDRDTKRAASVAHEAAMVPLREARMRTTPQYLRMSTPAPDKADESEDDESDASTEFAEEPNNAPDAHAAGMFAAQSAGKFRATVRHKRTKRRRTPAAKKSKDQLKEEAKKRKTSFLAARQKWAGMRDSILKRPTKAQKAKAAKEKREAKIAALHAADVASGRTSLVRSSSKAASSMSPPAFDDTMEMRTRKELLHAFTAKPAAKPQGHHTTRVQAPPRVHVSRAGGGAASHAAAGADTAAHSMTILSHSPSPRAPSAKKNDEVSYGRMQSNMLPRASFGDTMIFHGPTEPVSPSIARERVIDVSQHLTPYSSPIRNQLPSTRRQTSPPRRAPKPRVSARDAAAAAATMILPPRQRIQVDPVTGVPVVQGSIKGGGWFSNLFSDIGHGISDAVHTVGNLGKKAIHFVAPAFHDVEHVLGRGVQDVEHVAAPVLKKVAGFAMPLVKKFGGKALKKVEGYAMPMMKKLGGKAMGKALPMLARFAM